MHPITQYDIRQLAKFNVKNNLSFLMKEFLQKRQKEYHVSWVNGKKVLLRKGKTDILVFKKIFIDQEYNFKFKNEINTIIDAGANIGLSAIFFANRFPSARIIAIEPETSNYDLLLQNIKQYPNILPVLGGISNYDGQFEITDANADHWNFTLKNSQDSNGDGNFYSVETIMNKFNLATVDFIKIDIEGGEEKLFESNYNWLKNVKCLSIELHDFILPTSSNAFFNALCSHQPFSFVNYGENHFITFGTE
jgi:FkbM family methyltransferase